MSNFNTDITDQYLEKVYDDFQKQQSKILSNIKYNSDSVKVSDDEKEIGIIHRLLMNVIALQKLKKKIKQRNE